MRGNPNWRQDLMVGDIVTYGNQANSVIAIDGDTITLRPYNDQDADTFAADRSDLQ
jgi:hypothetical protein